MIAEEELIIPLELKTFLTDIANSRFGYKLGEPWKYSEESLGVVVPILRENAIDRQYITMYEVLQQLNIKDTGNIDQVELQNKTGMAIFVRSGTIFSGQTQNRASQHSGVYKKEEEIIDVCCVHASHGIRSGEKMQFGDIAPPSITMNLMKENQSDVWSSVRRYTRGASDATDEDELTGVDPRLVRQLQGTVTVFNTLKEFSSNPLQKEIEAKVGELAADVIENAFSRSGPSPKRDLVDTILNSQFAFGLGNGLGQRSPELIESMEKTFGIEKVGEMIDNITSQYGKERGYESDDLLGRLEKIKKGQSVLDDMMQKVPLFNNQVGAIIFNPVGVIAVETFDHPKSWEAIKKEIIEKYEDKITDKQASHIFELKQEMIKPSFMEFIKGLDNFTEKTIRKDEFSETKAVKGEEVIGEYTLIKGQPIHVLLLKDN